MATKPKAKWHSTSNSGEYYPEGGGGGRRVIPPDVIRKLAHKSKEGGTAWCFKCGVKYSMSHIRMVKVGFETNHACVWCVKEFKLQVVR